MKLIHKFLIGTAIMSAGTLGISMFSLQVVHTVEGNAEKIATDALPSILLLDELATVSNNTHSIVGEMLITTEDKSIEELTGELSQVRTQASHLTERYQARLGADATDRQKFEEVARTRNLIQPELNIFLDRVHQHDLVKAKDVWYSLDEKFDHLDEVIKDAQIYNKNNANTQLLAAHESAHLAKIYAFSTIFIVIVINMLLGFWAYRRVAQPLQALSRELQEFRRVRNFSLRFSTPALPELGLIANSLNEMVAWVQADTDLLKEQKAQILQLANHDQLTGLPVWRLGKDRLEMALSRARRSTDAVALLFIDLDGFKAVNDTFGHDAGDFLLKAIANRLLAQCRKEDTVARLGGDEYVVIVGRQADRANVALIAERMISAIAEPVSYESDQLYVGSSIGIALFPDHGTDVESLRAAADQAMYRVKRAGKNGFAFYA